MNRNLGRKSKISLFLMTSVALLFINAENAYAVVESAPTLDSVTAVSSTQIDLAWTPAGDGGEAITGYQIERNLNGAGWAVLVANTGNALTTYSDTTLTAGDTAQYRISTINGSGTSPASNVLGATTSVPPVSSGGCSGDCNAPTLGLSKLNDRIVTDGFSYNYHAVDVKRWHTEYPLIAVETGMTNILQAKIYDDWGANNIKAIRVAFGVPEIGSFYNGETIVEYYPNSIIGPHFNVIDKNNLLDNIKIKTWKTSCTDSETSTDCLMFRMEHMFREAPLANVVGISVSDKSRNSAQFYFNDGIKVEGDSLNPSQTATVPLHTKSGQSILLTQIDREHEVWTDEQNNVWTRNSYDTWFKITPDAEIKADVEPISKQGIHRNHAFFETYKAGQELLAHQVWNSNEIQSVLPEYATIDYSGINRMDNPDLQKSIDEQIKLAQEVFEKEFGNIIPE